MKNKIITLANNSKYVVCEELYYNSELYVCCTPYDEVKDEIDDKKLLILKVIKENEDISLSDIDEFNKTILREMFLRKLAENV